MQRLAMELGAFPWRPTMLTCTGEARAQAAVLRLTLPAPRRDFDRAEQRHDRAACAWLMCRAAAVVELRPGARAGYTVGLLLGAVRGALNRGNPGMALRRACSVDKVSLDEMSRAGWAQFVQREDERRRDDERRFAR